MEQLDDNQFAIEHLGQRRLVGDIKQNGGQRAADVGQDQGVGHGAHDVSPDGEAGLYQMPERDIRNFLLDLKQSGGDVHRHIHGGAHRADDDGGEDDRLQVDRVAFVEQRDVQRLLVQVPGQLHQVVHDDR